MRTTGFTLHDPNKKPPKPVYRLSPTEQGVHTHKYWYIGLLFQSWLAVECRQTVRDAVRSERRPLWSCHLAPWSEFGNLSVHFMIFIIFMSTFSLSVSEDFKGNHLKVGSSFLMTSQSTSVIVFLWCNTYLRITFSPFEEHHQMFWAILAICSIYIYYVHLSWSTNAWSNFSDISDTECIPQQVNVFLNV